MTIDQDRGAYAPHMDAPLAFDARRPTDRRPLPMTLIASAGVLVLIVGALAMAYRGGVRGSDQPKLVGQPVGAIKTAAAPEAASDAATDSRMDVYAAQNVPSQAPSFAPPPEQPKARVAAPAPVSGPMSGPIPAPASAAPSAAPSAGLQVRTVDPVKVRIGEPETTAAPVLTAADRQAATTSRTAIVAGAADRAPSSRLPAVAEASRTVSETKTIKRDGAGVTKSTTTTSATTKAIRTMAPADASPSAAKPAKAAAPIRTAREEPAVEAPAKVARSGPAAVQVGAFSSAELAQKGFADAGKLASLGGHAHSVEKVSRDGRTYYRATLGGFADKAAAKAFCAQITAKGGRCLVKS